MNINYPHHHGKGSYAYVHAEGHLPSLLLDVQIKVVHGFVTQCVLLKFNPV